MNCLTTNVWFELNQGISEVSSNAAASSPYTLLNQQLHSLITSILRVGFFCSLRYCTVMQGYVKEMSLLYKTQFPALFGLLICHQLPKTIQYKTQLYTASSHPLMPLPLIFRFSEMTKRKNGKISTFSELKVKCEYIQDKPGLNKSYCVFTMITEYVIFSSFVPSTFMGLQRLFFFKLLECWEDCNDFNKRYIKGRDCASELDFKNILFPPVWQLSWYFWCGYVQVLIFQELSKSSVKNNTCNNDNLNYLITYAAQLIVHFPVYALDYSNKHSPTHCWSTTLP